MRLNYGNFRKVNDWRFFQAVSHGVGSFYNPNYNTITICPTIMTGLFFDVSRPRYLNYGALGFTSGHEITHGFDNQGSQRDGDGNLVNWWQPETKKKYLEKTKCIIEQYGNYSVEINGKKIHLDGIRTQGENIADNGGVKDSFLLYLLYIKENFSWWVHR